MSIAAVGAIAEFSSPRWFSEIESDGWRVWLKMTETERGRDGIYGDRRPWESQKQTVGGRGAILR